jgi:hypothetical protein
MAMSSVSNSAAQSTPVTGTEIAVAVLKKAQDMTKVEGQLLLELMIQSPAPGVGGRINVYV